MGEDGEWVGQPLYAESLLPLGVRADPPIKNGVVAWNYTVLFMSINDQAATRWGAGVRLRFVSRMS